MFLLPGSKLMCIKKYFISAVDKNHYDKRNKQRINIKVKCSLDVFVS